jgi:hypothetical protein
MNMHAIKSAWLPVLLLALAAPVYAADRDGDGVEDMFDNCLAVANADQRDTDADDFGNRCDQDLNNDGKVNSLDLGLFKKKLGTADPDADFNGDGSVNAVDTALLQQAMLKAPGPTGYPLDPSPAWFDALFKELSGLQTNSASLPAAALDQLAADMAGQSASAAAFRQTLLQFYALNAADVEAVLTAVRRLNREVLVQQGQSTAFLDQNEAAVQQAVRSLNAVSLADYNMPFHLASLNGHADYIEGVLLDNGVLSPTTAGVSFFSCPTGNFPAYVGTAAPWKLRLSFSIQSVSRPQDAGCNLQHGAFNGTIRNWITYTPSIYAMIALNAWGGKLAANNNYFFYKWYSLAPLGFVPYLCELYLYARVY